jgi:hypothetical protein
MTASPLLAAAPPMARRAVMLNTYAVRGILAGTKTQLRRIVHPEPDDDGAWDGKRPYGVPGDLIWVREMWKPTASGDCHYAADFDDQARLRLKPWLPPLGMPRSASRITLEILTVRMERLQSISVGDIHAEGVVRDRLSYLGPPDRITGDTERYTSPSDAFAAWWTWSYGPELWDENPWVWAIEFRRC